MCLDINKNFHPNGESKIAMQPIIVWKSLEHGNRLCGLSPFRGAYWYFGKEKTATLDVNSRATQVERGLHAHILDRTGRWNEELKKKYTVNGCLWSIYGNLYPAVIPAGAEFFIGTKGDIVATEMTVYKDMESLLQAFNATEAGEGITSETVKGW